MTPTRGMTRFRLTNYLRLKEWRPCPDYQVVNKTAWTLTFLHLSYA